MLDGGMYEGIEADRRTTNQALAAVLLTSLSAGLGAGDWLGTRVSTIVLVAALRRDHVVGVGDAHLPDRHAHAARRGNARGLGPAAPAPRALPRRRACCWSSAWCRRRALHLRGDRPLDVRGDGVRRPSRAGLPEHCRALAVCAVATLLVLVVATGLSMLFVAAGVVAAPGAGPDSGPAAPLFATIVTGWKSTDGQIENAQTGRRRPTASSCLALRRGSATPGLVRASEGTPGARATPTIQSRPSHAPPPGSRARRGPAKSRLRLAPAAWGRCIARATRSRARRRAERSCRRNSRPTPIGSRGSSARRARWPPSITRTSPRCTALPTARL